ncbi:MAG: SAVED domain-containing protein [Vicinamibacterales bacterium]
MPSRLSAPESSAAPFTAARVQSRQVAGTVQNMLWGRSAGRCEFAGCNKPLWKSSVTQERVNIAQKAHIYAFSSRGPRARRGIPVSVLNSVDNLMLVCHECHQKIDRRRDGGRYKAPLLFQMKAAHEQRVQRVTGISERRQSHVLLYGANIGEHGSPLAYEEAATAIFPGRYPASDTPISLGVVNSPSTDRDAGFWVAESGNLTRQFALGVRERVAQREIQHLSVFALAPQPLLVLLGVLLGDINNVDVYQRRREPATWQWASAGRHRRTSFRIEEPPDRNGPPALVLSLSATVTPDRVVSVIGPRASIWTITTRTPHNDLITCRDQLSELRIFLRRLLDRIKATHGQQTPVHIFPAAPVSAAVELGRVRMPKADSPWVIYDQLNARGAFVRALSIPAGE